MIKKLLVIGLLLSIVSTNVFAGLRSMGSSSASNFSSQITRNYDSSSVEGQLETKEFLTSSGWLEVTQSSGKSYRVDANHIRQTSSGTVQSWVKTVVVKDIIQDGFALNDYTMTQFEIDCNNQKYRALSITNYQKSKKSATANLGAYSSMNSIIPESVGYDFTMPICEMNYILTH